MAPPDPRTDPELAAAARAGDATAFEVLYRRHRDWTVALAGRFAADRAEALDVAQEAWLDLLVRLPRFELTARFRAWMYPVVKHLAVRRRTRDARRVGGSEQVPEPEVGPEPVAPEELTDGLARALRALSPGHREVVVMRIVDGLEVSEVAAALGIPAGTVKSRLFHALARLRELLEVD